QAIEMGVAHLQDAVTLEGARQFRKGKAALDETRRERVAPAGRRQPAKLRGGGEGRDSGGDDRIAPGWPPAVRPDAAAAPLHQAAPLLPDFALGAERERNRPRRRGAGRRLDGTDDVHARGGPRSGERTAHPARTSLNENEGRIEAAGEGARARLYSPDPMRQGADAHAEFRHRLAAGPCRGR